jgi:hypothetical protein
MLEFTACRAISEPLCCAFADIADAAIRQATPLIALHALLNKFIQSSWDYLILQSTGVLVYNLLVLKDRLWRQPDECASHLAVLTVSRVTKTQVQMMSSAQRQRRGRSRKRLVAA